MRLLLIATMLTACAPFHANPPAPVPETHYCLDDEGRVLTTDAGERLVCE